MRNVQKEIERAINPVHVFSRKCQGIAKMYSFNGFMFSRRVFFDNPLNFIAIEYLYRAVNTETLRICHWIRGRMEKTGS